MFAQLSQAVNLLAWNATTGHPAIPPPGPPQRTKVRKPDQFDGSDLQKLQVFLVQCELNFQDRPNTFNMGCAKVIYMQSYLKGMVLDWFEHQLSNLSMKDNQQIVKYVVEFNRYTLQAWGYGEGALCHYFYNGLPDRIKDQIANVSKPTHLHGLHLLAQDIDTCYWERK